MATPRDRRALLTDRLDRSAATLCFLVAGFFLLSAIVGLADYFTGCSALPHGCTFLAVTAPVLLLVGLAIAAAGFWLWPRHANAHREQAT